MFLRGSCFTNEINTFRLGKLCERFFTLANREFYSLTRFARSFVKFPISSCEKSVRTTFHEEMYISVTGETIVNR